MMIWNSKEGHWANGVCTVNNGIHISDLDKTVTQGKVAETLDRFKF